MAQLSTSGRNGISSNYTAVLYFHGMGSQRRYEEVSRLVDSLDKYAHNTPDKGFLTKIRARLEPPRGKIEKDVSYIRVLHNNIQDNENRNDKVYRFYEYYWAPITAGGRPAGDVLKWLFKRMFTPFQTLGSPWRERQRLRRAALQTLAWKSSLRKGDSIDRGDLRKVLLAYNEFEGPDARRDYPEGSFKDFLRYIQDEYSSKPNTMKKLLELAQRWYSAYRRSEAFNTVALITLFLSIVIGVAALAGLSYIILKWARIMGTDLVTNSVFSPLGNLVFPNLKNTISLLVLFASLLGITGFLKNYLGDVELWTTYEETDEKYTKRKEILEKAFLLLTHVLEDPCCERVVIVGHSLGSAIAYDTLLEASRYNRARNASDPMKGDLPLEKIDHFITLGSPIDKIHYFFESHRGKYHRYNRVVEEVRGDIGTVPFARNRQPHMHWMNFWDQGDIVSGALETPSNNRWLDLRVDNIHVTNYLFPAPGACHSGYFANRIVMEKIFEVIFENKYSFHDIPIKPDEGRSYDFLFMGPGKFCIITPACQTIVALLPWLIVFAFGLYVVGASVAIRVTVQWLIYGIVVTVIGLCLVSMAKGNKHPFESGPSNDSKCAPGGQPST